MKKYLVEGMGTFFFALIFVLTTNNGTGQLAPLAIGAALVALVFAGGPLSGAHYNPAVSLAILMRGRLERADFSYYLLAQLVGGGLAAFIAVFLLGCGDAGETVIQLRQNDWICALVAEFLGTFALVYVVLNVNSTPPDSGNSHYGLAIGFVLMALMYGLGSISGGAFNPAVAVSMAVAGMLAWGDIWLYFLGPLLGGAVAATVFQVVKGDDLMR